MAQVLSADLSVAILPKGSFGSGTVSPNGGIRSARDHSGIADFASDGSDGEEARQSELEARAARNAMAIQHAGMIVRQVLSWALPCLQPVASLSCAAAVPTQTAHCWIGTGAEGARTGQHRNRPVAEVGSAGTRMRATVRKARLARLHSHGREGQ